MCGSTKLRINNVREILSVADFILDVVELSIRRKIVLEFKLYKGSKNIKHSTIYMYEKDFNSECSIDLVDCIVNYFVDEYVIDHDLTREENTIIQTKIINYLK